jgi:hypothetical protein
VTPASPTSVAQRELERALQRSLTALAELTLLVERAAAHLEDRAPALAHELRMRAWRIAQDERPNRRGGQAP